LFRVPLAVRVVLVAVAAQVVAVAERHATRRGIFKFWSFKARASLVRVLF
jgi:hypothetical protein